MNAKSAFQKLLDYHKRDNGSWKAECHGPIEVEADGPSLEKCRSRATEALDEKLAAWLAGRSHRVELPPGARQRC